VAAKISSQDKRAGRHFYDDESLEGMVRYYGIENNLDSLLRYIKNLGILDDDLQ
jgi:hypothetical protein